MTPQQEQALRNELIASEKARQQFLSEQVDNKFSRLNESILTHRDQTLNRLDEFLNQLEGLEAEIKHFNGR